MSVDTSSLEEARDRLAAAVTEIDRCIKALHDAAVAVEMSFTTTPVEHGREASR
jgi:hypothetical protein